MLARDVCQMLTYLQSNFSVNDKVYLKAGRGLTGPYLIQAVVRAQVYTLCETNGDVANSGVGVRESDLQLISRG